ncbi:MAG: MerR family DNA-binding transcriptional regulator, partial [Chlamydiae bacterium]|nr:MerR family DNA-binding transcriptional regulator [Chlamydiota bacterium]
MSHQCRVEMESPFKTKERGFLLIAKILYYMIVSTHLDRYIKIGEAAKILGISVQTLRRWEKTEEFLP